MNTKRLAACPFVKTQRLLCRTPFLFLTEPLSCAYHKFCVERVASFLAHSNGCLLFRAGLCVHFSCFAPVASFPALYFTYLLLARNWLRLFHRFKLLASFPALGAGCVFSHAGQYLHHFPRSMTFCLFPRQTRLASFPGLDAGSVFPVFDPSCILYRSLSGFFFPALEPACILFRGWRWFCFFPALKPTCILLRGWRRLRLFLLLTLHASYSALDTDREVCTSYNCGGPV